MRKRDEAKFSRGVYIYYNIYGAVRDDVFANCSARVASCAPELPRCWYSTGLRDGVFLHHLEAPILLHRERRVACTIARDRTINMHAAGEDIFFRRLIKVSTRAAIRIYRGTHTHLSHSSI
jgi:hypothetical protein